MENPSKMNLGGRPVGIPERLVLLEIAINSGDIQPRYEGVGIRQAKKLLRKYGANELLGQERTKELQKLGESADAAVYLKMQETIYLGLRYAAGFGE